VNPQPSEPKTPKPTVFLRQTRLVVTWPDGNEQAIPLSKDVIRIGRGAEGNDVQLPVMFKSISRQHLEIRREAQGFRAIDLESANGVTLNGHPMTDEPFQEGDELQIGEASAGEEMRIRLEMGTEAELQAQVGTSPTLSGLLTDPPERSAHLRLHWPDGRINFFPFSKNIVLIGRGPQADLRLPESLPFVSRRHAEIRYTPGKAIITDLNTPNGTFLNNRRIEPGTPVILPAESVIRVGDESLGVSLGMTFVDPADPGARAEGFRAYGAEATSVTRLRQVVIGRSPQCDIVLDAASVSRRHARIQQLDDQWALEDLGSLNGTFLDGTRVTSPVWLREGSLVEIGNFALMFRDGMLRPYKSEGMRLDATGLTVTLSRKQGGRRLLDDISLSVLPGEFVALVGGSGSGKTTLINALLGARRADGEVRVNGRDLSREYRSLRSQLGYVPQNNILHTALTVETALDYASRLRLPEDLSVQERWERIAAALDTVSMNTMTIRKTRIRDLSGGQQKRVSIAAELLADPRLIYLDEATSGLDPGLEKKMMDTLRRMADEGRTVVLVTHATNHIVQTDYVAFLSQGRLVYFGPSQESLDFFSVDEFADIYERIENRGEEWRQVFEQGNPAAYEKYIVRRQGSRLAHPFQPARRRFGPEEFARQLIVLAQRALKVLTSDSATLLLMLLLFPVTALLQLVISSRDILTGNLAILADPVAAAQRMTASYTPFPALNTFIFVMGLEAVLVGMYIPSNEFVRERTIYLRERMFGLGVIPYLLSKVAVYTLVAGVQTALYLLVLSLGVKMPAQGLLLPGWVELFITLFLTLLAGMSIGFVVSAISRSTDMAIYALVMLMFFQFFFAGAVFDLRGSWAEPLSYLTATRWSLTALGVTVDLPHITASTVLCSQGDNPLTQQVVEQTVCFNYPDATKDMRLAYGDVMLLDSWVILLAMWFFFTALAGLMIKRLDRVAV
jgi:ABC-type multidrug transport system ATPase subunit/pSer/pThr/pTyr-binding forkhead associated (FHA) protein/ABC-type multidrug transport system permease subunit